MPATIRLFHISDLHFGAEDRGALDWLADQVAQHRPHGVICTGDLTMRGRGREFDAAGHWLAGLGVPVSVWPGNHDMPYYWDPLRRLLRPYERFHAMHRAVHRDLGLDGVGVVPLKTIGRAQWRLNWSKGRVRRHELTETLAGIAAMPEKALRLVACHHPLVDADTRSSGSTRGGRAALAALARAGVHAVLSGHVHDAFDRMVEADGHAIRIIGAGTLSERLRASPPSYNLLEWSSSGGLEVSVCVHQ